MAKTMVADVIIPTEFEKYAIERTAALSAFADCGIIEPSPQFDTLAAEAGGSDRRDGVHELPVRGWGLREGFGPAGRGAAARRVRHARGGNGAGAVGQRHRVDQPAPVHPASSRGEVPQRVRGGRLADERGIGVGHELDSGVGKQERADRWGHAQQLRPGPASCRRRREAGWLGKERVYG